MTKKQHQITIEFLEKSIKDWQEIKKVFCFKDTRDEICDERIEASKALLDKIKKST